MGRAKGQATQFCLNGPPIGRADAAGGRRGGIAGTVWLIVTAFHIRRNYAERLRFLTESHGERGKTVPIGMTGAVLICSRFVWQRTAAWLHSGSDENLR